MENAIRYAHVDKWADNTDLIGRISDVTKFDITDNTSDASKNMDIVSGMSSEYSDELGGLRRFDIAKNDSYLKAMVKDSGLDSPDEVLARALVDQAYDRSNNTTFTSEAAYLADQAQKIDDSNFAVAA
jgi:putative salt-induced outer membrane protein YdiY